MSDNTDSVTETKTSKKRKNKLSLKTLIVAVVSVLALGTIGYLAQQNHDLKQNPNKIVKADQQKLLNKIGTLMSLPTGEEPSIATVSDKAKLKDQAFFKNAQNGDTLLIYTNARKAILYREKTNKIIEVAPIAIDTPAAGTTTTPAENQ
jgi:uncharacterized protein HemX